MISRNENIIRESLASFDLRMRTLQYLARPIQGFLVKFDRPKLNDFLFQENI